MDFSGFIHTTSIYIFVRLFRSRPLFSSAIFPVSLPSFVFSLTSGIANTNCRYFYTDPCVIPHVPIVRNSDKLSAVWQILDISDWRDVRRPLRVSEIDAGRDRESWQRSIIGLQRDPLTSVSPSIHCSGLRVCLFNEASTFRVLPRLCSTEIYSQCNTNVELSAVNIRSFILLLFNRCRIDVLSYPFFFCFFLEHTATPRVASNINYST